MGANSLTYVSLIIYNPTIAFPKPGKIHVDNP